MNIYHIGLFTTYAEEDLTLIVEAESEVDALFLASEEAVSIGTFDDMEEALSDGATDYLGRPIQIMPATGVAGIRMTLQ
jgi:hypothetical protein